MEKTPDYVKGNTKDPRNTMKEGEPGMLEGEAEGKERRSHARDVDTSGKE